MSLFDQFILHFEFYGTGGLGVASALDDDLQPKSREFLGDPEAVAKAAAAVAAQGKAK